ncbi:Proton-dependent oligopeptide transporter family [Dillenia turbinata]|uniref:Proton-dependent oligopeptide transporter family n=1 Tax=Dillenia turbinata TaxID=194707 RepID=A0AAN8W4N0_9MAGN
MEIASDQKPTMKQLERVSIRRGGMRTMPFVIANETFEKVASVGLNANMILYLMYEYHLDSANGASILFLWGAISNFMPIIGAFLSDSNLGRFRVISMGTIVTLIGMVVLWLTSIVKQAQPPECNIFKEKCKPATEAQLGLLFSSFVLMSIGAGGIRPCSLAFGADQFDRPDNPKNARILQSFFNWYYASVGVSLIISVTLIVYIQDEFGWVVGFGVPVGLMFLSTVFFLLGAPLYVKVKANKSLFTGFAQVIAASFKNKHLALPPKNSDGWYHHTKGSKLVVPTERLRFLNKACIIKNSESDLNSDGSAKEPWNLCTVQQVEALKALLKVIPIWSSGIMIAVTISQNSFPVLQARTMDRHLTSKFKIPAASFGVFAILTLTIWVGFYDRVVVPLMARFTRHKRGLSLKTQMGIGLVISCIATAVAGWVESMRRARAINEGLRDQKEAIVNMSAMWLIPQHCLFGLAEGFNAIGQINFYYAQFPKSMASIGVALFTLGMAIGNLMGSVIVDAINSITKAEGKDSWVANNLNRGHYDYYYWILSLLSVVNFFYYLLCSWIYGPEERTVWDEGNSTKEEDINEVISMSPITIANTM